MYHYAQGRVRGQIARVRQQVLVYPRAGLEKLLPRRQVVELLQRQGVVYRQRLYTPLRTLWLFLYQVLAADASCRAAVARWVAALSQDGGVPACSARTESYCKARERLPEPVIAALARETGGALHRRFPTFGGLFAGRPVKIVDGTTCSMPDTRANQAHWPQPPTQKPGLGFPLVRLVALLALNCAALLDVAMGPYAGKQRGETALFRSLLGRLQAGDIVLADRYYASYWMMALLRQRGVDALFRQHQLRRRDFRRGRRLGSGDHVITLVKPAQRPAWMDAATYQRMPPTLEVREVRVHVAQRGFRVRRLVVVTTLLDPEVYPRTEVAEALRLRWQVELDLRAIKPTMHMSVLRCQTPAMVRKEIWTHLLAYNLIRTLMAEAAQRADLSPREVSLAGAVQTLNAFAPVLQQVIPCRLPELWKLLLYAISRHRVGNRPNRYEPRAVKRRAKPIALLTVPRPQARLRLAKNDGAKC